MESMNIDRKGLRMVAERFLKRHEVADLGLKIEDVEKVLLEHAKNYGGCINCIYSAPYHGRFTWLARHCVLGLRQDSCPARKPIIG